MKTKVFFTITEQILVRSLVLFLSSISGQTHEFIMYAMWQQSRINNLTLCYRKSKWTSVFHSSFLL